MDGDRRDACMLLVWRTYGKSPLGRTRRRWDYTIKMDLLEVGWESMNSIVMAQGTY
jgi:hypothetical protein